jgi:putative hemolysin
MAQEGIHPAMHFVTQSPAFGLRHDFPNTRPPALVCEFSLGSYRCRLADSDEERESIYRLRFLVFNLELNEGLESGYENGMDVDDFDGVCDHIYVEHAPSGAIVGTYRVQTGDSAAAKIGYYSEREFDFTPYESLRHELLELGRACIHRDHRSFEVLSLLWKAVGAYATGHQSRYLIGCSSLTSQDPATGWIPPSCELSRRTSFNDYSTERIQPRYERLVRGISTSQTSACLPLYRSSDLQHSSSRSRI